MKAEPVGRSRAAAFRYFINLTNDVNYSIINLEFPLGISLNEKDGIAAKEKGDRNRT